MTALLLVRRDPNNHNLPQSGRLFILRGMGIYRRSCSTKNEIRLCRSGLLGDVPSQIAAEEQLFEKLR